MKEKLIAHVRKNDDGSWAVPQDLMEHLINTAKLAEENADKFHSADWGNAAGLAHDTGKGRTIWQEYLKLKSGYDEEAHLEGKSGKMPHAVHGARLVEELFGKGWGRFLAYCIAGHHAGLPDWSSSEGEGQASLQFQETQIKDLKDIDQEIVKLIHSAKPGIPPWKFEKGLDVSLWIRMLYSSLVDADFLDTESYMDPDKADSRGGYCSLSELQVRFNKYMKHLDDISEDTRVNEIRRYIRAKCIDMASQAQGIFSLSVPTGGGKTLSSLAFALEHAATHDLDRIIYVIPYTSIIEQNADVFRAAIGDDQVVEHHSSLADENATPKSRLAAENWDAPLIVTTSVQFFESLFAAKSSRCRKLHSIVRSVVVLDEAQLMPVEFLGPILETMQLLVDHYQVSFVISTATQPAFRERVVAGSLLPGLKKIKEIMGDAKEIEQLYQSLKRNQVELPANCYEAFTWEEIAAELKEYDRVLCVVSDRKSCRELHSLMPEGTFHLSALMCGQHRSEIIAAIKQRLQNNESVRVISTQLVEAGVDLDFPVVFRALAGLDSIAQAAGRCNREGKQPGLGKVVVFVAPRKPPLGILRKAAETTVGIVYGSEVDPISHSLFERYFSELYWKANSLDAKKIKELLSPQNDSQELSIYFRTAADRFQIINSSLQKTILVPYGKGEELIGFLKSMGPDRWLMRKLQRFTVNIYNYDFEGMRKRGSLEEIYKGIFALRSHLEYSDNTGLLIDTSFDPEDFIL